MAGSSAAVVPVSALSRRAGRRVGLTVALGIAALGAGGVVLAGVLASFALLCVASVFFGVGNTAVMLARYAAADLSSPGERGRAIGRVVFAHHLRRRRRAETCSRRPAASRPRWACPS